ncbi:cell 12A endoglucanase [Rhizoctonia solani AG-3 Rhs1AP]|uniref:Cell 12A endoglucanase n=1 Tax=Rhizoctonia solani AG-3 Rhs1AP TaxID=1086054 RepID=X8JPM7_9AGAM|nr:cell 12A endoglucanase [Rhizoctonia solani AG-3 Rhs1AP]
MAKLVLAATFLVLSSMVGAKPIDTPLEPPSDADKSGNVLRGEWDSQQIPKGGGQYTLYNNLWGSRKPGTTGSQITEMLLYRQAEKSISWKTQYNWQGNPNDVKSYANVALENGIRKKVSSISSIPTTWSWKYDSASNPLTADVSYDLWLSRDPKSAPSSSSSTVEVMVWLSNRHAGPAGSQITTIKVGGLQWQLFKGRVGTWDVYSFVATNELKNYHADLLHFLDVLRTLPKNGVDLREQYLVALQAGTEPFHGSATLTTSAYTVAIN